MSDAAIDRVITVSFMALGFLMICAYAGKSLEFQRGCETACGDSRALTPVMDLQEACLCDEGHGKWRRIAP
jgi:hypothetical protein